MLTYTATSYTCFALFQLASISSRLCRDHLRELRPLSPADVGLQIIWGGDKRIYSIDTPRDQQVAGAIFTPWEALRSLRKREPDPVCVWVVNLDLMAELGSVSYC